MNDFARQQRDAERITNMTPAEVDELADRVRARTPEPGLLDRIEYVADVAVDRASVAVYRAYRWLRDRV